MNMYVWLLIIVVIVFVGCDNIARFPISTKSAQMMDDRIIGDWKFEEDTNSKNFYRVMTGYRPDEYHIQFFNRGGSNRTYESNTHFSEIDGIRFLNLPCFKGDHHNLGYLFIRILETNDSFTKLTAAVVGDTTMMALKSEKAVHKYVTKNMYKPQFYSDTIHLYKVE